jgi:hypothetical protein
MVLPFDVSRFIRLTLGNLLKIRLMSFVVIDQDGERVKERKKPWNITLLAFVVIFPILNMLAYPLAQSALFII